MLSSVPASILCTLVLVTGCGRRTTAPPPPESSADAGQAVQQLRELGVKLLPFTPPPPRTNTELGCRVEDGVQVLRGANGVRYSKPLRLNAKFALQVARFEAIAEEEALRVFGRKLMRIDHAGTYVCRSIAGAPATASQHAFGNAIDVTGFVLRGGRRISVARHFTRGRATPATPQGEFLARVLARATDERLFRTVLTPDWDARHHDHFHLDGRPAAGGWWRRLFG